MGGKHRSQDLKLKQMAEAVHLYHREFRSFEAIARQREVRKEPGAKRMTVHRDLLEAHQNGWVHIGEEYPTESWMEEALQERFHLKACKVAWVPLEIWAAGAKGTSGSQEKSRPLPSFLHLLGRAAARYIESQLDDRETKGLPNVLAISPGWSLYGTIDSFIRKPRPCTIYPLHEFPVEESNTTISANTLVNLCWYKFYSPRPGQGATAHALLVPPCPGHGDFAEDKEYVATWRSHYQPEIMVARRSLTMAIMTISNFAPTAPFCGYALRRKMLDNIRAQGAVSEVLCHAFNDSGRLVETEIEKLSVGLTPHDIIKASTRQSDPAEVVCIAGSKRKVGALLAALKNGRMFSTLITDSLTARALLE